jgi:cell wall-associated NlpC family hydrolase
LAASLVRPEQFYHSTRPDFWNSTLQNEFEKIAIAGYPNEVCAYVVDNQLVPVENISPTPTDNFALSNEDTLLQLKAQGFVHSHPNGPFYPSAADMISQKATKLPFGIVTTSADSCSKTIWVDDATLDIPIESRPFVHGIFDCYSLIRAYYKQTRQVVLPDFPRDYAWWEGSSSSVPLNLYMDNFEKANFSKIPSGDPMREGDVILMSIQTKVVSHAAVYLGNGLLLHHLRDRIARKDQATSWKKFYHTVVRFNG